MTTRAEKIKATMIANIRKEYGNLTAEQADKIRISRMKAASSKGGKNGTGHAFGHGSVSPQEVGRKGAESRWRKRESAK